MICPKCQHEKTAFDTDVMEGVCPKCGIAYNKWQPQEEELTLVPLTEAEMNAADDKRLEELYPETFWQWLYRYACFMPSDRHESAFWGHGLIYVFFVIWGLRFIFGGIDWITVGGSFLHLVNLPFHEYGHVMFSPFGTFMMFLGGSLFQIMLPMFPLFAFMVMQRDNFAASIMLWWVGQNFIDVSVYIADAPLRALPLINGNGDGENHDWWNLLNMTNSLDSAGTYANLCFLIGVFIILLSNVWGGHLLWIEFKGRTEPGFTNAQ
ncbi:MAG: TFIIB-type zinc ribbon-containing protein [Pseudomonadota bacterium]